MLLRFKDYRLDTSRGSLCRGDRELALRPKCFEVLRLFLENPKRLISKQELAEAIWPNVVATDESISRAISDLRIAIGDDSHGIIKTVPRRGYVFDETVLSEGKVSALGLFPANASPPAGARDKASIAVLPFLNLNGDRKQDYIADGLTEDITTELSRFSALLVIARNSAFQYKGKSADVRQIGTDLGARYVLEGSIRRNGRRVRIVTQLIEASSGSHRWAERFDTTVEKLLAVQDEVVRSIVGVLAAHLNRAEIERTLSKPIMTWQAYDFHMRAKSMFASYWSTHRLDDLYETRRLLEHAISIDPEYAILHADLAATFTTAWVNPLDKDHLSDEILEKAYQAATKAIQLAPQLPQGYAELGNVLVKRGQHEAGVAAFMTAQQLNPNSTDWRLAGALVFVGKPKEAIRVSDAHTRLDPFCSPFARAWRGRAFYMMRRYSDAIMPLEECSARAPAFRGAHLWLAATYAQLGRHKEARTAAAEVLRIDPAWTIQGTGRRVNMFKHPKDAQHFFNGLRKAGLPET